MPRHSDPNRLAAGRAAYLGALVLLLAPSAVWSGGFLDNNAPKEPSKKEFAVPAARMEVEGEGLEAISAELHNAELRVREAKQNVETAEWAYGRARTRSYPRGEALQEIKDRVVDMRKERDAAEAEFSALVEKARREGMPMGTLTPYMDLDDQIRRERATRAAEQPVE